MRQQLFWILGGFLVGVAATVTLTRQVVVHAQQTERPGCSTDHPIDVPHDLSGLSIKNPRIRVVHTTDPWLEGGSMYLQQTDPWLGYMWGKSLTQRNFRDRDGVYGDAGKIDGILLPDGVTKMMDRSHTNSCGACHNVPYRDAGAGMTIPKNGGSGRNTPHMFGGGLMEMIGLQMRLQALAIADANHDGWISKEEAKGKRCLIQNLPDGVEGDRVLIDFGSFDDEDGDGYPDLNPVFWPIFVDKNGERIPWARNLNSPEVAGYTFEVQVFGFGTPYMPFRPAISTTLRAFTLTPFDIHSGMQAHDPPPTPARSATAWRWFPMQGLSSSSAPPARTAAASGQNPRPVCRASVSTTPIATVTVKRFPKAISTSPSGTCSTILPRHAAGRPATPRSARSTSTRSAARRAMSRIGTCWRTIRRQMPITSASTAIGDSST